MTRVLLASAPFSTAAGRSHEKSAPSSRPRPGSTHPAARRATVARDAPGERTRNTQTCAPDQIRQLGSREARICLASISQLLPRVSGRDAHQLPTLRGAMLRYVDLLDSRYRLMRQFSKRSNVFAPGFGSAEAVHGMRSGRSASGQGRERLQVRYIRQGAARPQAVYVHGLVRRSADVRICVICGKSASTATGSVRASRRPFCYIRWPVR